MTYFRVIAKVIPKSILMLEWYTIVVNVGLGRLMMLAGFKVIAPKFESEEAKEKFYKKWGMFYKIAGTAMAAWGFYNLAEAVR